MVTQIVADVADGVAYAVTHGAGIYKTTNGGQRWRSANEGLLLSSGVTALVETDDAMTLPLSLQSSAGNYVAAENGGANGCKCDSPLNASRLSPHEWETFVISIR